MFHFRGARVSYLKHHNFPVVSLEVEGPGGGDEALGRADDIIAPAGHGLHHRGGLGAESHGSQLPSNKQEDTHTLAALNSDTEIQTSFSPSSS